MYTQVATNGQPVGLPANFPPEDSIDDWRPLIMPPPRTSECQELVYKLVNGSCVGEWVGDSDPMSRKATIDEIRTKQLEFELAPISLFGNMIDCDDRAEKLMRDALASWSVRELDGEWFFTQLINSQQVKVLKWKLADNSTHTLTFEQLTSVYNSMLAARAARGQQIWIAAQKFKLNPPTVREVNDITKWLSVT